MQLRRPFVFELSLSTESIGRFAAFIAAVVVLSLAAAAPAYAQSCTDTWTGSGGDGQWSDGSNWSTGKEPGSGDNVCIQKSGAAVHMDVSDGIANLTVGKGDSLALPTVPDTNNGLGILGSSIVNDGQISLAYDANTNTGDVLSLNSGITVTLSGSGSLTMSNTNQNSIGGNDTLLNKSKIQGAGSIDMTINNASKGVIDANQSGAQVVVGRNQGQGSSSNAGLMEATNGGQLVMGSLTLNNVGGTIKASGKNSYVQLEGEGQGGETFIGGTWTTANGGAVQLIDTSVLLDGTNGNTITNSGTMQLVDGASHPGGNFQGVVNNTGTIQILSRGNQVGVGIPGGQTWTLMGSGSLTLGDGTDHTYNNQVGISGNGIFANQQLVQGTGYILNLPSFTNSGTINANVPPGTSNLQLQLGRSGTSTNTGTIEASNGGALVVGSTTIDNVGGTFEAVGTGSYVDLVGSLGGAGLTISGGTFTSSNGGVIYGQGFSTLDGTTNAVVNSGTLVINDVNQNTSGLNAQGTLNNTGTIKILSTGDQVVLAIPGGQTLKLTGGGTVVMGDGTDNSYNLQPSIGSNLGTDGTFDNRSTVEGTGGMVLTAAVTNNGTMIANVPPGTSGLSLFIDRVGNIQNNGTVRATNGGVFYIGGGSCCGNPFSNAGTMIADAKSTLNLQYANPFGNLANGTFTGGTYKVTGTMLIPGNITTNAAKITLTGKASQILNPNTDALAGFLTNAPKAVFVLAGGRSFASAGTFNNYGSIVISGGSTFTVGAGGSFVQHGGKIRVDGKLALAKTDDRDGSDLNPAAADIRIVKGALFGSGGKITAHVSSSGTVVPGNSATSPGTLTITRVYTQNPAGALDANIAGASSGQFGVLSVKKTANLGGTLNIQLLDNFVPSIGATFKILTAQAVSGTFATVNGTAINDDEHFTVTYNSDDVTLEVVSGP